VELATRCWFAVRTKPRREWQARLVLDDRGIEVYLPEIPMRQRRGDPTPRRELLFPGYMFARLAVATPEWVVARSAPGVAYFLGSAGSPAPLPDGLVDEIRARVADRQRLGWRPAFATGDRVVIDKGPFVGLEAVFDRVLSPRGRVRVFLEIVSRLVPLDLDVEYLIRAR
jgi:transcriptional antiterminator RfaH